MKKRTHIVLGIIAAVFICFGIFTKWSEKTSIGIIGGADGPTAIIIENSEMFDATILEVHDSYYLVEPAEGSRERNSADKIKVSIKNLDSSLEPEVGDLTERVLT